MPEESNRSDFKKFVSDGSIQWHDIFMLARSYDVSTHALVWRLANLELISKDIPKNFKDSKEVCDLDRGIERNEDCDFAFLPERCVRLAYKAYNDSKISIGRLADLLELSVSDLKDELRKYDIELYSDAYKATIRTS